MPYASRRRTGSRSYGMGPPSSRGRRYGKKMSVPRAIRTRGTPGGYYEIPVQNRFVTGTNKGGFLVTNQSDFSTSGVAYQGGAMWFTLSDVYQNFGVGAITLQQGISVPGLAEM